MSGNDICREYQQISNMHSFLNNFRRIDLSEMSAIKLMNRIDTKYMTNVRFIPELLEKAAADYRVQIVENNPAGLYRTLY